MEVAYINKIQKWVEIDNTILRSQEGLKVHQEAINKNKEEVSSLLEDKKKIEDEVLEYIQKNKMDKLTINISDGTIKFGKKTTQQNLTIKTLKTLLDKYSEGEDHNVDTNKLFDFILDNLEKKTTLFMKRDLK
jgi:predicted site-specific integrase-resolvase